MNVFTRTAIGLGVLAVAMLLLFRGDETTPADRGQIFSAASLSSANVQTTENAYLERIAREPNNANAYVDLGQLYLLEARRTAAETEFVPRAEAQLKKALDLEPDHYRARVLNGTLLNKLHQFEAAEALARQLIQEHPGHAYNYGTLVDALVELGRYEEAVGAMDRMLERRPDLSSYARASYIRELMGDSEGAIRAMEMAAKAGVIGSEGRSWAVFQLAQMALAQEDFEAAERLLTGVLEESPGYAHAMAGLAHLSLLEGDLQEAESLVEEAIVLAPGAGFEELAAEVYLAIGHQQAYQDVLKAIEEGLHEADAIGENVQMELADFWADTNQNLDEALWLASQEVDRRPDHMHANETYAWVLHKLGRSEQAIPYIDHARRYDNGDAMVTYRAGRIYLAAGQPGRGVALLEQSLEEGLRIESPSAALEASSILRPTLAGK